MLRFNLIRKNPKRFPVETDWLEVIDPSWDRKKELLDAEAARAERARRRSRMLMEYQRARERQ